MEEATRLAIALLDVDGVGRVTAGRLLAHFPTLAALRSTPREQVLARLKGAPRAADLVRLLFDQAAFAPHLAAADAQLSRLATRKVNVATSHHPHWPQGLSALALRDRPLLLYAYGQTACLTAPSVAFFARPPLDEPAFEAAQALARYLKGEGVVAVTGADHGFDVVIHKIFSTGTASSPSAMVAPCGLAKLPPRMRPTASAAVRAGGALLSPFPMDHGPFPHDDRERALTQAALADACVFIAPVPDASEGRAMAWCIQAGRPTFGLATPDHPLPEGVHPLRQEADYEWVAAAVHHP